MLMQSRAGNPESMLEMWERGDGDEAGLSLLKAAASAGLVEAQYQMGMLVEGSEWLEVAARAGHVKSMLALAERVDGEEGAEWLKRAASTGEIHAVMALALRYQIGGGAITEDHGRAAELYTLAAERGDAAARVNLGLCYLGGRGVPRDDEKGAMHIVQAAESGFAEAQYILGTLHMRGVANVIRDDVYGFRCALISSIPKSPDLHQSG
jgi:TPR repeat protein